MFSTVHINLSTLSFLSLNARGLHNNVKCKALFLFARQFKSDFVYLQESHSNSDDANFWRSQWGNSIWLSHGTERSAGVATLKNRFNGDVLLTECDPAGHFICQAVKCYDLVFIITNVYGYNTNMENDHLFLTIENILVSWLDKFTHATLLLGVDFNNILDGYMDKWPPSQSYRTNAHF